MFVVLTVAPGSAAVGRVFGPFRTLLAARDWGSDYIGLRGGSYVAVPLESTAAIDGDPGL